MKKRFEQLTCGQRVEIYARLQTGRIYLEIAEPIGVNKSTVGREIKRNRGRKGYRFRQAHEKALSRRRGAGKKIRFTAEIKAEMIERLKNDWSPEQISGRLKAEGRPSVSCETIYRLIPDDPRQGCERNRHLRLGRKKRCKRKGRRGQIPSYVIIDGRPAVVDERTHAGNGGNGIMIGKNHRGELLRLLNEKPCSRSSVGSFGGKASCFPYTAEKCLRLQQTTAKSTRNIRKSRGCPVQISSSPILEAGGYAVLTKTLTA
ncbi:MAG: IS30 family transposase [candidate division KSB1 bacterium]|nr:IS30 family transposase [candidate division KSB1 bacterium]